MRGEIESWMLGEGGRRRWAAQHHVQIYLAALCISNLHLTSCINQGALGCEKKSEKYLIFGKDLGYQNYNLYSSVYKV